MATSAPSPVWALTSDGATVAMRGACPDDVAAVLAMYRAMSPDSMHLRFFGISDRAVTETARRVCGEDTALLALDGDTVIGVAEFIPDSRDPSQAELALAVADEWHGRGVGTLLVEHLVVAARTAGVKTLTADVLGGNRAMLRVFADLGLAVGERIEGGVVDCVVALDGREGEASYEHYLQAVAEREQHADRMSLGPLFEPRSIAVAGAGRHPDSVGRAVLRGIRDGGFTGSLAVLHPSLEDVDGIPAYAHPADLPQPPDLLVVAVPAGRVPGLAEECGQAGVRTLLVLSSGFDAEQAAALRRACRTHGMRMVGPNCLGIAGVSGAAGSPLNATFGPIAPHVGDIGVAVQSGGVGIALAEHLNRLGLGVSTFVSLGDKYDVSGNDMLQWWDGDARTRLCVLHLESFGNPRKFSRIARRVSRRMPVLTVDAGRSEAGRRAAASHTAAAVTPTVARGALFRQAGVTAVQSLGDLIAVTALLHSQPLTTGGSVAVIGNAGGVGVLAADACVDAGLAVAPFGDELAAAVRAVLPPGAACGNPVDTGAAVTPEALRACVDTVAASDTVDAVVLALAPTALGDPLGGLLAGDGVRRCPVLVVAPDRASSVELSTAAEGARIPVFNDARTAAVALAHTRDRADWLATDPGGPPPLEDLEPARARAAVGAFLRDNPAGGWASPAVCAELLGAYGIRQTPWREVHHGDEAAAAAAEFAAFGDEGRVVLKGYGPGLVHKSDHGAVRLRLDGPDVARAAYEDMAARLGPVPGLFEGAIVQPMAASGVEVIIGVTQDEALGPVIVFGAGGTATEVLADHGARLAPLTYVEATGLVVGSRVAPLLFGHRGAAACDTEALRDVLLRMSRLAEDLPQVTDVEVNPAVARPDGVDLVDVRVHLAPRTVHDPFLRRLR